MKRRELYIFAFLSVLPVFVSAQFNWHAIGPYGGKLAVIDIAPSNPNIIYVGSEDGGVFKSVNAGEWWERAGLAGDRIRSIAIDPTNPEIVYISRVVSSWGGEKETLKTEDGGNTWRELDVPSHHVAASPAQPGMVFASNWDGIYKSLNWGESFVKVDFKSIEFFYMAPVFDPVQPEVMYIGANTEIFKSIDSGDHWQKASVLPYNREPEVLCISVSRRNHKKLVIGTRYDGVFMSSDSGIHWEKHENFCNVFSVFCNDSNEDSILCGNACGYATSADFGKTWDKKDGLDVVGGAMRNNRVYFLNERGATIERTDDWGKTWDSLCMGLQNTGIESMLTDEKGDLLAAYDNGYTRILSIYDGAAWDTLWHEKEMRLGEKLFGNRFTGHSYSLSGWNYFSLSEDGGKSWLQRSTGLPYATPEYVVSRGDTLLLACSTSFEGLDGGIFKSFNEGGEWFPSSEGLPLMERLHLNMTKMAPVDIFAICEDPSRDGTVYAGGYEGIYRSDDFGESWRITFLMPQGTSKQLIVDPDSSGIIYAIAERYHPGNSSSLAPDSLYVSRNEGDTFTGTNTGLVETYCLYYDTKKRHLYAGGPNGVARSKDRGIHWEAIGDFPDGSNVVCLTVGNDNELFAGTRESGIYKIRMDDSGISGECGSMPGIFRIHPNFPNPFNPVTTIRYTVMQGSDISIRIFDILGKTVRVLHDGFQPAGEYQVRWEGRDDRGNPVESGVYLFTIRCGDGAAATGKMLLAR